MALVQPIYVSLLVADGVLQFSLQASYELLYLRVSFIVRVVELVVTFDQLTHLLLSLLLLLRVLSSPHFFLELNLLVLVLRVLGGVIGGHI